MHLTRATTGNPSTPDIRIFEYPVLSRNIEYYSSLIFTSSPCQLLHRVFEYSRRNVSKRKRKEKYKSDKFAIIIICYTHYYRP